MRILQTPIGREEAEKLRSGDIVYVSGRIFTARDGAHKRALSERSFPEEVRGGVVFHAGPVVEKSGGDWRVIAVGPTTSSRMNLLEPGFLDLFKPAAVIGKGGMDERAAEAFRRNKAVYLSMAGGCAASAAERVKKVEAVHWLDLGVPEAVWVLRVEEFGPLIVSIDSHGRSLYEEVREEVEANLRKSIKTCL
jgi:tartrate/fumarate subfamily iron-sulfur-dependent hydro-lyase beta chain